ncbi:MAG: FeoB-associated Cys-rich membrane protein [Pirellulales bacterium]|nr:FeoB-associated Cys-rich membrane protein [Pirellulales bacterium]
MYVLAATIDWQSTVAGLIVLAAAGYLARRAWQTVCRQRTTSCGACASCPAERGSTEPPLVALEALAGSVRREPLEQSPRG